MYQKLENLIVTPTEMAAIDRAAAASGLDTFGLMTAAGEAIAAAALREFPGALRFVVLCGPGNNGGDGYVAARALLESGSIVAVFTSVDVKALRGDAEKARRRFSADVRPLADFVPQDGDLVIDALFGAGLSRDLSPEIVAVIKRVTAAGLRVLAVDLPSGVSGATGRIQGAAFQAVRTVTFMCRKPGHLLMPGRGLCGALDIVDIGIPARIVMANAGPIRVNGPEVWAPVSLRRDMDTHKYKRGHLAVFSGGPSATGAARMSALAGLKAGAGLVTIAAPEPSLQANAMHLTSIMLRQIDDIQDLSEWIDDRRIVAFVLGPGFGIGQKARDFVHFLKDRMLVLDADGISSFRDNPDQLFDAFAGNRPRLVLTPHEGEFARLFPDIAGDKGMSKVQKALGAAKRANAALVYKGADTVVASPDGRVVINTNAPPSLATAGSGDVLAGIIGGLLAQGIPVFEAAAAGVWMHGEAAKRAGPGLIAEELPSLIDPRDGPCLS